MRICFICRNTKRIQAGQFAGLPCPSCGLHKEGEEKCPDCSFPLQFGQCQKCQEEKE